MRGLKPYSAELLEVIDQRIKRTCHPKQRAFVFDPGARVSALVSRGGGKTIGALMRMVRRMARVPGSNCLFIAATRDSAERLVWQDLKRIVKGSLNLPGHKFNESKLTCVLGNGSRLMLFGADDKKDVNNLRGITYHEVAIDEVASIRKDILDELLGEVLGPRMVGTLALIGTPGKELLGLFYDATRPGSPDNRHWNERDAPEFANWDKWSLHTWNIKDGVEAGITAMEEIYAAQLATIAREGLSPDNPRRRREYDGLWAADSSQNVYAYRPFLDDGAEWNQWQPKLDARGFAILPSTFKDWSFAIGIDVGFKDAFALEVFAFSYSDTSRTLYHVYEVYRQRMYANQIAKLLIGEHLDHNKYGGIFAAIGYPDVMVGDFAGQGGALLTELGEVYGITVTAAEKPYKYKENSIELLNSALFEGRIKVMKGSKLADEMVSLQWTVDQWGKRTENKAQANHACDSLLYLRDAVSPLLASVSPEPTKPTRQSQLEDESDRVIEHEQNAYQAGDADAMYAPGDW